MLPWHATSTAARFVFRVKWFRERELLPSGLYNVKRNSFLDKLDWLEADDVDCQVFFGSKPDSDWSHVFEYRSFSHIPSWWLSTQEEAS